MSTPKDPELHTPQSDSPEPVSPVPVSQSDANAPDVSADATPSGQDRAQSESHLTSVDVKFLRAFRNLTSDEEKLEENGSGNTLRSILGGDILSGEWFQKQLGYILMLTFMVIIYISNRYACQQEIIETKNLNDTLLDRRYKALTRSAQLKESTRRSRIEQTLEDSAIQTAVIPSFYLKVNKEE